MSTPFCRNQAMWLCGYRYGEWNMCDAHMVQLRHALELLGKGWWADELDPADGPCEWSQEHVVEAWSNEGTRRIGWSIDRLRSDEEWQRLVEKALRGDRDALIAVVANAAAGGEFPYILPGEDGWDE